MCLTGTGPELLLSGRLPSGNNAYHLGFADWVRFPFPTTGRDFSADYLKSRRSVPTGTLTRGRVMFNQPVATAALLRLRELSGLSRRVAARQIGVDKRTLQSWEDGSITPDADQVAKATRVYGRDLNWFLENRESITDPAEPNIIRVGSQIIDTNRIRLLHPGSHEANRAILNAYVDAVRLTRGVPVTGIVELRALDISQLAKELDVSDPELAELLADIFKLTPAGAQSAARAVLIGSLMALTVAGLMATPWFTPVASAASTPAPSPTVFSLGHLDPTDPHGHITRTAHADEPEEFLSVFSTTPRNGSQAERPATQVFSPDDDRGLQALPAGSPELPEN